MVETLKIDIHKTLKSRLSEVDFNDIQFGRVYSDHMFTADFNHGEWSNFTVVPYDYLKMTPGTCVLHYGQSVFEGLKAYHGKNGDVRVFRPYDNQKRLNISAQRICMPDIPEEVFIGGMMELLKLDRNWVPSVEATSLYIRPFVFATDEYIGLRPSDSYKFIIFTCPVGPYYLKPVRVKVETKYVRAFRGGTGFAKAAGNYGGSIYPAKLAHQEGYDQVIWTDGKDHKYIEEAGSMNLLFIIDDVLLSPDPEDTILRGITRESVLTLAREWGLKVEERKVSVKEVIDGIKKGRLTEAFGAGTAATIAHISTIGYEGNDYDIPPANEGSFSKKVYKYLDDLKTGKIEDDHNWILTI